MPKSLADELMERRTDILVRARAIAEKGVAENRDLTQYEQDRFNDLIAEADQLHTRAKEVHAGERRSGELDASFRSTTGADPRRGRPHMLHVPDTAVRELCAATNERRHYSWQADAPEHRAALVTGTYGTTTGWHGPGADAPLLLHDIGGAAVEQILGLKLAHPVFTLPTASAAVAETVTVGEYAASTAATITAARFGRWTDISVEASLNGTNSILRMHAMAVARDLNAAAVAVLTTAAGAAVTYATGAEYMVKRSIAVLCDRTASEPGALMLIVNPSDAPEFADTTPTNGADIASTVERFSGARIFASTAVTAGTALVANLGVGLVYGSAQPTRVETDFDVKTSVSTLATSVIGGYGVGIPEAVQLLDITA
jgi:hypothetical protein